jgi:hypothetical protein
MIDVLGPTSAEEGLQKRVGENAGVESVLQTV